MDPNTTTMSGILNKIELGVGAWAWGDRFYWNYGGSYNKETVENMFNYAIDSGISFFDTAEVYGQGRSEQILGELIKKSETTVKIATKFFPYPWRFSNKSIERALERSLDRLKLDSIFLYQIHWPRSFIPIEKMMNALSHLVELGKTKGVGISNFNLTQTRLAHQSLKEKGIPLISNQVEYHLLDRHIEKNGLLNYCRENDIRIISYSPLAQGLLSGKYSVETPPPGIRSRKYSNQLKNLEPLLQTMREIGISNGNKSPSQVALNWLICKNTLPIPGAKNLDQLKQNIESTGWRLPIEAISALDEASESTNN
jgi:aryl-alcohol dehydrogenase-like predicted oxidoreductase